MSHFGVAESVAAQMRAATMHLLDHLDDAQREAASLAFDDDAARRWIEYRPRPGVCLADQHDANHAHTVLRRPVCDFGAGVLAAHRAAAHRDQ